MKRKARIRRAATANSVVTVLGVVGFLGFLAAARMDDPNASPFDYFAFGWLFTFAAIKACMPWLFSKRSATGRTHQAADSIVADR